MCCSSSNGREKQTNANKPVFCFQSPLNGSCSNKIEGAERIENSAIVQNVSIRSSPLTVCVRVRISAQRWDLLCSFPSSRQNSGIVIVRDRFFSHSSESSDMFLKGPMKQKTDQVFF